MNEGNMKRTSLFLDRALLKRVMRALDVKTYSAAVKLSLAEILRIRKVQALPNFFGKGLWEGDLSEMREHRPAATHRRTLERRTKAGFPF